MMKHLLCAIAMLSISGCLSPSSLYELSKISQLDSDIARTMGYALLSVEATGEAIDYAISNKQGRGYTSTASIAPSTSTASIAESTPLCDAANRGNRDTLEALLAGGADVNGPCRALGLPGQLSVVGTPLHAATSQGAPGVAGLLLDHGANVNAKNEGDRTPLHVAAMTGNPELVRVLLAHGAEVDAQDKKGRTPLHEAVFKGDPDVVELLLTQGAKINMEDEYGMSPMRLAADPKVIGLLKQHANNK